MWLPIHDTLLTHPKLFRLMRLMELDSDHAIAALLRFWWWCLDYAPDGDLRRYSSTELGAAAGFSGDQADLFPVAMLRAGFLDETPYFRVHDWWDYAGPLFRAKHKRQPQVWKRIRDLYVARDSDGTDGEGDR
jgi:hypothetical protein